MSLIILSQVNLLKLSDDDVFSLEILQFPFLENILFSTLLIRDTQRVFRDTTRGRMRLKK